MLESDLEAAVRKKDELEKKARECENRLERAGKLIGGLGGERARWGDTIAMLTINIEHVVGDVAVAAGAIAYTGPFTSPYRKKLNAEWVEKLIEFKVLYRNKKYFFFQKHLFDIKKVLFLALGSTYS